METNNEIERLGLVHRTIAFGLAVAATTLIASSVAFVFTPDKQAVGTALVNAALAPLRVVFGG